MKPYFSVIISNFNHGRYLGEAIQSVLRQSLDDFEIVVVDGGSSDNSVSVIKSFGNRIAYWISEKDSGQSNAFNKGFSHARGEFFTWLNADDLLLPCTLEKARFILRTHSSCRWLTGNFLRFLNDGRVHEAKWGPRVYPGFLQRPNSPIVSFGPTSFFHRSLFQEVGGFDESLHYTMDTDLWTRFIVKGEKQCRLNHYCWAFRMHEDSKTAQFGSIRHSAEKLNNIRRETKYIRDKTGYNPSKLMRLLCFIARGLDGSLIVSAKNNLTWKGRYIRELTGR
jgi:glycosyltransferase involved in cell wall biosynthesis